MGHALYAARGEVSNAASARRIYHVPVKAFRHAAVGGLLMNTPFMLTTDPRPARKTSMTPERQGRLRNHPRAFELNRVPGGICLLARARSRAPNTCTA